MDIEKHMRVCIIGTGPAGLTAAIYAARANLEPTIFAGPQHGGQLTITTEVENFPGFKDGILGPELMATMTDQAARFGTEIIYSTVNKVDFSQKQKIIHSDDGKVYTADTVIICTGASAKTLKLEGESKLMGRGLSTCATCDGFFFKNEEVAVVGGGDSAMEESNYLSGICKKVYLIHRRDEFRASPIMVDRCRSNSKIEFLTPYTINSMLSDKKGLTGVVLQSESGAQRELPLSALFMAIGHIPNSKIFKEFLDLDGHGYIKVNNFCETNVKGVYAAGDIADPTFKQAITAAGMGCQAALLAQRYLDEL